MSSFILPTAPPTILTWKFITLTESDGLTLDQVEQALALINGTSGAGAVELGATDNRHLHLTLSTLLTVDDLRTLFRGIYPSGKWTKAQEKYRIHIKKVNSDQQAANVIVGYQRKETSNLVYDFGVDWPAMSKLVDPNHDYSHKKEKSQKLNWETAAPLILKFRKHLGVRGHYLPKVLRYMTDLGYNIAPLIKNLCVLNRHLDFLEGNDEALDAYYQDSFHRTG